MHEELDKALCEMYPYLYKNRNNGNCKLKTFQGFPSDGWFQLIWELSKDLEKLILHFPESERILYTANQVKKKDGTLYVVLDRGTREMYGRIRQAEILSSHICEICGDAGKIRKGGHIAYTSCDYHLR